MSRLLPNPWVLLALVVAAGFLFGGGLYVGREWVAREWKAAEGEALGKGVDARKKAEEAVARIPRPKPGTKPCAYRDIYDRDCRT